VLKGIDMCVEEGAFITLLGPSGCGKSTLLRCLAGLEPVSSGTIYLDGKNITNVPPQKRNVGMVFQQYSLFPNLNVYDNIAFGLRVQKLSPDIIRKRVERLIDSVELNGKERAFPSR
jgi:putative spermidine/putrescine transport system ATP-binding protein